MERAIARGASIPATAKKFGGLSRYSLFRHIHNHLSAEAKAEFLIGAELSKNQLGEIVVEQNESVLLHYGRVRGALYLRFDAACLADDRINVDRLAGRLHENFRDVSRITGELQRSPLLLQQTNNIVSSPDNARLIAEIVSAVAPFREARIAVAQALRRLEAPALIEDHSSAE
jgi:hypothetical protein